MDRLIQNLFLTLLCALLVVFISSGVEGSNGNIDEDNKTRPNQPAKRLFVFGDSYADTGNTPKSASLVHAWKVPYGMTFPGHPSGRFCDGRLLTDFIAKFLGFVSPIPYTQRKLAPYKARHGMNFAFGGTGALETVATAVLGFPNMTTQIDYFQKMLSGNDIVRIDANLSDSVAYVSLVGNDYNTFLSGGGSMTDLPEYIKKVVAQLTVDLQRIKSLGVGKILLTGLQPLGCLPQATLGTSYKKCYDEGNVQVQFHNKLLRQVVDKLNNQAQNSGPQILILELYNTFFTVFKEEHGPSGSLRFKDALKPCCIPTTEGGSCSDVDKDGNKLYTLCDHPKDAFFWDSYHPAESGWRAVFTRLKPALQQAF